MIYDVAILGGGVIGCALLNKLTRVGVRCVLLEKGSDVAVGTSKANSGIVHAGFDAKEGTLKAILNVKGAKMYPKLCKRLGVKYVRNGALVVGDDISAVRNLYTRGKNNGVKGLEILDRAKLLKILPNITENVTCGLYAKTSAIVSPYELTIALADESVLNGGEVLLNFETKKVVKKDDYYMLSSKDRSVSAKKIIIAVGGSHNEVAEITKSTKYDIKYRRGEYYLLDRDCLDLKHTVFPLPTKHSKGVLISPTVSNNIIVGPTSILDEDCSTKTTVEGLSEISNNANSILNNVDLRKNIRVFSGVRTVVGDDFVIEKDKLNEDIINVTGICSPGLTATPAIAEMVADILGVNGKEKKMIRLKPCPRVKDLSDKQLHKLIQKDGSFGKIVCRCECITEGEILHAINSPLKPMSVDGVKRRTRAGMGRCQGGFCFMRVIELIARERNIPIDEVLKENESSNIIVGDIK